MCRQTVCGVRVAFGRPVRLADEPKGTPPQQQHFRRIPQCLLTCLLCVRVLLCCCIHIVFNVLLTSLMACLHGESSLGAMPGVFPVQVRDGQLATAEGVSYLEAKYLLLLHYCIHLVFYVLLKAEGRSARDHPVIARLVEIRAFLERARPIDKRLRYQMDRLLAAAALVQVSQPGCGAAAHRSKVTPMMSLVQGKIVSTLHASHVFKPGRPTHLHVSRAVVTASTALPHLAKIS